MLSPCTLASSSTRPPISIVRGRFTAMSSASRRRIAQRPLVRVRPRRRRLRARYRGRRGRHAAGFSVQSRHRSRRFGGAQSEARKGRGEDAFRFTPLRCGVRERSRWESRGHSSSQGRLRKKPLAGGGRAGQARGRRVSKADWICDSILPSTISPFPLLTFATGGTMTK